MFGLASAAVDAPFPRQIFELPLPKGHAVIVFHRLLPLCIVYSWCESCFLLWLFIIRGKRVGAWVHLARVAAVNLKLLISRDIHMLLSDWSRLVVVWPNVSTEILVYPLCLFVPDRGLSHFAIFGRNHVHRRWHALRLLIENIAIEGREIGLASELDRVIDPWLLLSQVDIHVHLRLLEHIWLSISIVPISGRSPWHSLDAWLCRPRCRFHYSVWMSWGIRAQRRLLNIALHALSENAWGSLPWLAGRLNSLNFFNRHRSGVWTCLRTLQIQLVLRLYLCIYLKISVQNFLLLMLGWRTYTL